MAITTTYFTGTTADSNRNEVRAWLNTNATDYFSAISTPAGSTAIQCKIDGVTALTIDTNTNNYIFFATLKNGMNDYRFAKWGTDHRFTRAVKTSCGILLYVNNIDNIFITKNTDGGVIFAGYHSTGNSTYGATIGDFANDSAFKDMGGSNGTGFALDRLKNVGVQSAGRTALVPAVTDAGTYSDNLFFVPFTQFIGQSGITIDVDGTKYVYNGVFALKE